MSVSDSDIAFARELFAPLGEVTTRKMFGGLGLYSQGAIFGIVSSDGQIYLKAMGDMAAAIRDDGGAQFHNMPYWGLPDAMLDDPEAASALARRCIDNL